VLVPPSRTWQSLPSIQLFAAFIGVAPLYALAILGGLSNTDSSPLTQMPTPGSALVATFAEVIIFGGIIVMALYILCGESLGQLNLKPGTVGMDLLLSLGLLGGLFLGLFILAQVLNAVGLEGVPDANLDLGEALAADPALAAVFLGPVVWLKAALLEELSRLFLLSRLWKVYPTGIDRWAALLLSSVLFGLGHIWQGPTGILGTTVIGFILGAHYLRHGRVLPLIVVHGVYDTLIMLLLIYVSTHELEQLLR
jgi:membrane protease YdiL (CAAX protease family)